MKIYTRNLEVEVEYVCWEARKFNDVLSKVRYTLLPKVTSKNYKCSSA